MFNVIPTTYRLLLSDLVACTQCHHVLTTRLFVLAWTICLLSWAGSSARTPRRQRKHFLIMKKVSLTKILTIVRSGGRDSYVNLTVPLRPAVQTCDA